MLVKPTKLICIYPFFGRFPCTAKKHSPAYFVGKNAASVFFGRPKRYARKTDENYYRKKQSFFGSLSGAYKTMILFVSKHAAFVFLVERFLPQHWSKDVFVKPTI
jgi:hypothetical protein